MNQLQIKPIRITCNLAMPMQIIDYNSDLLRLLGLHWQLRNRNRLVNRREWIIQLPQNIMWSTNYTRQTQTKTQIQTLGWKERGREKGDRSVL